MGYAEIQKKGGMSVLKGLNSIEKTPFDKILIGN